MSRYLARLQLVLFLRFCPPVCSRRGRWKCLRQTIAGRPLDTRIEGFRF